MVALKRPGPNKSLGAQTSSAQSSRAQKEVLVPKRPAPKLSDATRVALHEVACRILFLEYLKPKLMQAFFRDIKELLMFLNISTQLGVQYKLLMNSNVNVFSRKNNRL